MPTKRIAVVCSVLFFFLAARFAQAHGSLMFEFAPDISSALQIASVQTPSQPFMITNDAISGIDLWIENTGAPGSLTVELRNSNNALLASRTVTIPAIPAVWAGTRRHIDFNTQITVNSGEIYRLRFISTVPFLSLYYTNRAEILQHNAAYLPTLLTLPALLGTTEQEFTFKYALYETQETIPPVITNATTTILSPTSVRIDFHANEPVDFRATYTPSQGASGSTNYTNTYTTCGGDDLPCSLSIEVAAGTSYSYVLTARDVWGNEGNAAGSFTTPAAPTPPPAGGPPPPGPPPPGPPPPSGPDTTPPTILNAHIVNTGSQSVTVAWETNEAADTKLTILNGGTVVQTVNDTTFELAHVATANGLLSLTSYTAIASSKDPAGNNTSVSLPFATGALPPPPPPPPPPGPPPPGPPPPPPPGPPSAEPPPTEPPPAGENSQNEPPITTTIVSQGTSGEGGIVTLSWDASRVGEEDGFRVDVFDENLGLTKQIILEKGSSSVTLDDLAPGTYTVIVYASRNGILEKIGPPVIFEIRGPSSFSIEARIWFTVVLFGLIIGTGSLILVLVKRKKAKPIEIPRSRSLYQ